MKKLLWTILIMSFYGCASLEQWGEQYRDGISKMRTAKAAAYGRQNLVGMTANEIEQKFGNPREYSVSYSGNDVFEYLTYYYYDDVGYERSVYITLTNGAVSNVVY